MGSDLQPLWGRSFMDRLLEYRSVHYANLNGFSWQFQLVLCIKNIPRLCILKWVFMGVLWTHLLEYQSAYHANLNGFSWQFKLVLSIKYNGVLCYMAFHLVLWTHLLEYQNVHHAKLNGFLWKFIFWFWASRITECIVCKFKWVLKHQAYQSVYCTNLNGFSWQL